MRSENVHNFFKIRTGRWQCQLSLQSANPHQEMDMPNIQRQSSAQPSLQPGPTGTGSLAKPDGYSCPQPDTPVRDGGGRVSAREV